MKKPTVEEIDAYIKEKGYDWVDAQDWFDYWESRDWQMSKTVKMQKWKHAVSMFARISTKRPGAQKDILTQMKEKGVFQ